MLTSSLEKTEIKKSGIDDFLTSLASEIDRKYYSYDCKDNDDSDKIYQNINDRTVASGYKQLMIFIKYRIKDRKP